MDDGVVRLHAGDAGAGVSPRRGAALESLRVAEVELLGGIPPVDRYPERFYSGCFVMAPFAGLLPDGAIDGAPAPVRPDTPRGAEHGTVYDAEWEVEERAADRVVLRADLGGRWPYDGRARVEYALAPDALTMTLRVEAAERMPAALGFHPWFRCDLGEGPATVSIAPAAAHAFDERMMATTRTEPVPPRPWDHVLAGVADDPVVRWPGLTLRLSAPTETWVVYEPAADAFCVEPVTAPAGAVAAGERTLDAGGVAELPFTLGWRRHRRPSGGG